MAEDQAPEQETPAQDTPQPETPAPEQGTPEQIDYEKRYNDLRPEYDRTTQENAQLREIGQAVEALQSDDPQMQQWAVQKLGLELVEDETPETPEWEDTSDPELEAIKQAYRDSQQAQETQAQTEHHASVAIQALNETLKPEGREMGDGTDPIDRLLFNEAFSLVRDGTNPAEAAQAARELVDEVVKQAGPQAWAKTKNVSSPALGREAAEEALPLDAKHGDRAAHMVAQLEANQLQQ